MAGCDPRPRRRALGCGAVALAAVLAAALASPAGHADPAPAADLERAKDLYRSAEAAMTDRRFDDAARDYGAAYELSRDPALFFKIGHAHERAGKCEIALVYYARYLRDGQPSEPFAALTRERIAACGGTDRGSAAAGGGGGSAAAGAAGSGAGSAGAAPEPPDAASAGPRSAGTAAAGSGARSAGGAAAAAALAAPVLVPPTREKIAWLMSGGGIALAALGGVLAYAARSSENDVRDLYAGLAGQTPTFDGATHKRYADLVDEGQRYEHLSWAAFGLAGAAAVGAAVLFAVGRGDEPAPPAQPQRAERTPAITPVVGPRGAGVSVRF